ncbi:hypothetical protein PBCV1_a555R [Paramecium bursaria Chlorella virus 1]|uniref:Uncharacterized protein n=1 Tax=Paramecium bursaria Chlorella virus 1 TaxID=10506 RepID=O41037_PBCV1|nr:hypothetical protein PBCV1_a555R [Paramecium bursaria Chlorella virus 1]AAC96999.1 hypothetical protein [Paramecium bursaria Chlorella virus 1]
MRGCTIRKVRNIMTSSILNDIILRNAQQWSEELDTILNNNGVHTIQVVVFMPAANILQDILETIVFIMSHCYKRPVRNCLVRVITDFPGIRLVQSPNVGIYAWLSVDLLYATN